MELIISAGVSVVLTTVIFAVRPLREAFLNILDTVWEGPRRFIVGLAYIISGRTNPRTFELELQEREITSAAARRKAADAFYQKKLAHDLELQKRNEQHINDIREWQEEYIRIEDPELYAKHIAPNKKQPTNVLSHPEVGSFASYGVHADSERRVSLAIGQTFRLEEPDYPRLEVSERRWNPEKQRWGHYKRFSNGNETWAYES